MQTRLTLKPTQKGAKRLLAQYGDKLLCVRYRYDRRTKKRYKTVELIVEEVDWEPRPKRDEIVGVKVAFSEIDLRHQVKNAGGQWNPGRKMWELRYDRVVELGLEGRMAWDTGI
jgi:hypothetical protein